MRCLRRVSTPSRQTNVMSFILPRWSGSCSPRMPSSTSSTNRDGRWSPIHLVTFAHKQFVRPDRSGRRGRISIRSSADPRHGVREPARSANVSSLHQRFVEWADEVNRRRGRETEFEEILGYHLEQAYRYRGELGPLDDEAVALGRSGLARLASAGRRALARGDFPAAANLLDRASRVLDEGELERTRLLVSAGEAYLEIGEFTTADDLLGRASSEAQSIGDGPVATTADLVRFQLAVRIARPRHRSMM